MKISVGPTGCIARGDVLDVNPRALERQLQSYDRFLYLNWNPNKGRGYGMWEVRRRPEKNTHVIECEFNGATYVSLKPVEIDIINHVLDVPFLNYNVVTKIKAMDTWQNKNWVDDLERMEREHKETVERKAREERAYNLRQHKREISAFRELVLSGHSPAELARYWGSKGTKR